MLLRARHSRTLDRLLRNQNALAIDPTRTTSIWAKMRRELNSRMNGVLRELFDFLVVKDALDLEQPLENVFPREFRFNTDPQKLNAFNDWFAQQVALGFLGVPSGTPPDRPWLAEYVDSSYRRGLVNAFLASRSAGLLGEGQEGTTRDDFARTAFAAPESVNKLRLLYIRTFEELRGVTADMSTAMSRILAQGLADGKGPLVIAREMAREIRGMTQARAFQIARTEIIRSHAEGQLEAFRKLGVQKLGLRVEWLTAGDDKVCPRCNAQSGKTFTLAEASGKIPLHPNCVSADSLVESPDCLALTRAKYFGSMVQIKTFGKRSLSVTENHILLTQRGWVRAKNLMESDQLIQASSFYDRFVDTPNNQNRVSRISDVFDLFLKSFPKNLRTITGTVPEYFHGDGSSFDKEIDIVCSDCVLWDKLNDPLGHLSQFSFMMGDVKGVASDTLQGFRTAMKSFHRHSSSPYSLMRGLGVFPVLVGSSLTHHKCVRCGEITDANPTMDQSSPNRLTSASEDFSDLLEAFSVPVVFDKISEIEVKEPVRTGLFVFDIWSHSSAYSLEGLLSSNCRCSWTPFLPGRT